MGEKLIDISEWQAGMDVERVVRENNIAGVMVRSNYGSQHDDLQFHKHCDGAERGGAIVLPYVYPLATDTRGSIDDCMRIIGERYDRCAIDWEAGSGNGTHLRIAHERAWELGLRTPLVYDPKWYWEQQGSPNVDWMGQSGKIEGHWKSWYPDNIADTFENILRKLPDYVWNDNRGGIPTLIVQFTSSAILKGWGGKVDGNWFRGTKDALRALLLGEEDMAITDADAEKIVDHLLTRVLLDSREEKPDGEHNTTVANALWSTWHTPHFGDAVNGLYPSNREILDAIQSIVVSLTPEDADAIARKVTSLQQEKMVQAFISAFRSVEGIAITEVVNTKIGFAPKPIGQ